ncbi:MAG: hypothetical protein U0X20_17250 [Caldilineaceae bacterium]
MARGRLLPTSLVRDRRVARLSIEGFAYYQMALAFLDRDGLMTGDPDLLLADLAPLRRTDIDIKMRSVIQEWTTQGLFVLYGEPDNPVLFCPDFRKWNREMEYTKEAASVFPPPPGYFRSRYGLIPNSTDLAQRLAEDFGPTNLYGYTLAYYAENGTLPAEQERPKKPAKTPREPGENDARPDRAPVESNSRLTPHEDQDQEEHGVGGVQTDKGSTPRYGKGGDARGGADLDPTGFNNDRPPGAQQILPDTMYAELAEMYVQPTQLLIEAAIKLGDQFNIWQEYRGNWRAWLDEMDHDHLLIILTWLWKWHEATDEELAKMKSMIAVLRKLVKENRRADLRPHQMHEVLVYAGIVEEEVRVDL